MFKYWQQSALNNPTIDFLLVTDSNSIESFQNIKVVKCTFENCVKRFQSLFNFTISLNKPYKLCDFKPVYGDAFADYCKGYDFWGFGDIDLVYGNIRKFITDDILSKYWIISGWGHLTLYRNIPECTLAYKKKEFGYLYYKDVLSNPQQFVFDEYFHGGMSDRWKNIKPEILWDTQLFDDIIVPYIHFNFVSFNRPHCKYLLFEYDKGHLFRIFLKDGQVCKEETLYVHLQQRKFMKCDALNTAHFLIIPNRFIEYRAYSENEIRKWGQEQKINRFFYDLHNKIKRRLRIINQNANSIFTN